MITVDGRTDEEKLRELLSAGGECTELELKAIYDFSKPLDSLEFVKDTVAMFNHYPGGYLIIGLTNDGKPSDDIYDIDWKQFDGAKLTDKVRKYVKAPLTVLSAQHEIEGHKYCLICCLSPKDGLPIPFSKQGQADNNSNPVFHAGDIVRRDGAQVRSIEYSQWSEILEQHDEVIRHEERERIDELIERITVALSERGTTPLLDFDMNEKVLVESIRACFIQGAINELNHFIDQVGIELGKSNAAPILLASIAAYAASYRADDIFNTAVDKLYQFYLSINNDDIDATNDKLSIILALYEIGAAAEISSRWELISPLVNRQSRAYGNNIFASWIRECQVYLSNNHMLGTSKEKGSQLISQALADIKEHPMLAPCIRINPSDDSNKSDELTIADNSLLDALCSFDFLYCICVFVAGNGKFDAYPAFVDFSPKRLEEIDAIIFGPDDKARRALLPGYTDEQIASGLMDFCNLLRNEAMSSGTYRWTLFYLPNFISFINENTTK